MDYYDEYKRVHEQLKTLLEEAGIDVYDLFLRHLKKIRKDVYVDKMNELRAKDPEDFDRRIEGPFPPQFEDAVATAFADGYEIGYVKSKIILLNELLEKGILCEQTVLAAMGIM